MCLMLRAVAQSTTTRFAHMLGEAASLHHGDDLVLTIRAGHATGVTQGDDAFVARPVTRGRRFEVYGAALVTAHGGCGRGGWSLAGREDQRADGGESEERGADEFGFHGMDAFGLCLVFGASD